MRVSINVNLGSDRRGSNLGSTLARTSQLGLSW